MEIKELSIDTTFDPPLFPSDYTFKLTVFICKLCLLFRASRKVPI